MRITVTIPDEVVAQVQARGLTPESYVEKMIEERTEASYPTGPRRKLSLEEFRAALEVLAQFSEKIPVLPIEAFSRESFYEAHD